MKRPIAYSWAALALACVLFSTSLQAAPPPASCRRIILSGKIETPANFPAGKPVLLSMNYQMNYQKHPAVLFVNYPVKVPEFVVSLYPFPPLKPKRPSAFTKTPESLPTATTPVFTLAESAPETQAETQPAPEQVKLGYIAEKMFLYPREIDFQYYAKTEDGRFVSPTFTKHYVHEKKLQTDGSEQCESDVALETLVLKGK